MAMAITMEDFVHSHYANGRGMALMTAGAGLVGLAIGTFFLSEAHFDSDLEMGGLFVLASLLVTALGAVWWWLRRDPTRTGVYEKLVRQADRMAWVALSGRARPMWMFYRDDGEIIGIPSTTPGPARFGEADLAALFRTTYPRAMVGGSEANSKAYFASLEQRGITPKF